MDRRAFVSGAVASAAALALPRNAFAASTELAPIHAQVKKRHDEAVRRLQQWIRQPTIAAENKGIAEGCALTMGLFKEAGFQKVTRIPSDGHPGILATLDAGARNAVGVYFMYDVKQVDPSEWSSPPWAAALVDKTGVGKVMMGRGAVNQKGPQAALLAALHAIRGAGRKPPVNLVLVAEGEVELELIASGEKWGRGPRRDIHSSNRARVDSPAWHLVQALNTLVTGEGGDPAIEGFADKARPVSSAEKAMIAEGARRIDEARVKKLLGVERWVKDASWQDALERLVSRPTVNIQGLVGGYTGPGGKTILPARAAAKLDLRLVPDMTRDEAVAALQAHLKKRGLGDIEVKVTGRDISPRPPAAAPPY